MALPSLTVSVLWSMSRTLGHAPKRGDVGHRHYISLDARDLAGPLEEIEAALPTCAS